MTGFRQNVRIKNIHYGKRMGFANCRSVHYQSKKYNQRNRVRGHNFLPKGIVDFDCTYAVVSEQSPEQIPHWKNNVMMWNTEDRYLYLRLTPDNRIIIGGRDERFSNAVTRQDPILKKQGNCKRIFNKALPDLAFKKEFAWSGTFGKTRDSLPYIGAYKKTPMHIMH